MIKMNEEDGGGTTPEIYTPLGYKNISFVEDKGCLLFAVNKILSTREWLPLMGITLPFTLIPGEFIALIKEGMSIEEALELINERIGDSVVQEILREEKYSLRDERKRPWAKRTRRPFRGAIDKTIITFDDELELAERVVMELGLPWKTSSKGRPLVYDGIKLAAAILVKGTGSFVQLATDLRSASPESIAEPPLVDSFIIFSAIMNF